MLVISVAEKGAREKVDQLNKTLSETELSRQNAVTHWQQEAENIRQNYRVSQIRLQRSMQRSLIV
jgi:hypothetical protein